MTTLQFCGLIFLVTFFALLFGDSWRLERKRRKQAELNKYRLPIWRS